MSLIKVNDDGCQHFKKLQKLHLELRQLATYSVLTPVINKQGEMTWMLFCVCTTCVLMRSILNNGKLQTAMLSAHCQFIIPL